MVLIGAVVMGAVVGGKVGAVVLIGAVVIGAVSGAVVLNRATVSTLSGWTGDGEMTGDFVVDEKIFSAQPRTAASLLHVTGSNLSSSRSSTTQI